MRFNAILSPAYGLKSRAALKGVSVIVDCFTEEHWKFQADEIFTQFPPPLPKVCFFGWETSQHNLF